MARNQIDYILIRKRKSVKNCKIYLGADIGSDNNPLVCKIAVRFKRVMPESLNQKKKKLIEFGKLATPEMKKKYLIDVKNTYEIISMETDAQEETLCETERKWNCFKNSVLHVNENAPKTEKKKNKNTKVL